MTAKNRKKNKKTDEKKINKQNKSNGTKNEKKKIIEQIEYDSFFDRLFEPVDNSCLIFFRIMWGLIMMYECYTYMRNDYRKSRDYYLNSNMEFKYYYTWFVKAWSVPVMKVHFWAMAIAGFGVTTGLFYRLSTIVFFLGFVYKFSIDACLFLNHFYLISVFSAVLIFLPANQDFSLDALIWPKIRSTTMPRYCLYLLRGMQTLVYTFAGLVKINPDWLRSEPLRHWLSSGRSLQKFPELLKYEPAHYFFSYGGLFFDNFVGFLILVDSPYIFYPTLISTIFFHSMNKILFSIGIFPQVMLASTTLYFNSDWFRRCVPFLLSKSEKDDVKKAIKSKKKNIKVVKKKFVPQVKHYIIIAFLVSILIYQVAYPFRSLLWPGRVEWNELGQPFSWRMKLRDKRCTLGMSLVGKVKGEEFAVGVDYQSHLFGKQHRKTIGVPALVIQAAHQLADHYHARLNLDERPQIYAEINCSLNYRPVQKFLRPVHDLAAMDPWDYVGIANIIEPLDPLTEELIQQYPWNWEWNFNWLFSWPLVKRVERVRQKAYYHISEHNFSDMEYIDNTILTYYNPMNSTQRQQWYDRLPRNFYQ